MVTQFLVKIFRLVNNDLINDCRLYFNFMLPSEMIKNRMVKFESKFVGCNSLQRYFDVRENLCSCTFYAHYS